MTTKQFAILLFVLIICVLAFGQSYSTIGGAPIAPTIAGCTLSGTGAWSLCPVGSGSSYQMYVSYNGGAYQLLGATGATGPQGPAGPTGATGPAGTLPTSFTCTSMAAGSGGVTLAGCP
jgi:hypothetical protein